MGEGIYNLNGDLLVDLSTLTPGITVCIPAHPARFRSGLLSRALNSVFAQTLQPERVLILNDTGREGVPDHLEKLKRVADETDSVYVFSWFHALVDPLGHFGLPFNPCSPYHTTMGILERTDLAKEVGFPPSATHGRFSNEDWAHITGFAKLACERGLKMTHLAERTWTYSMGHGNTSGLPGQGDAR